MAAVAVRIDEEQIQVRDNPEGAQRVVGKLRSLYQCKYKTKVPSTKVFSPVDARGDLGGTT